MATAAHELEHAHRPDTSSIATNRWGPYSGASDFTSNMAVVLAALLALLALALALNAAIRYLLRRRARRAEEGNAAVDDPEKPPVEGAEAPPPLPVVLVYSASGTKLAGAAAECAICLAEFVDGDDVRVMPVCGHGFHARCIDRWLAARGRRSSCPTCRAPATVPGPPKEKELASCSSSHAASTS
jgi:E3 ubiquitin-protein ligase ATL10/75/76/77/78